MALYDRLTQPKVVKLGFTRIHGGGPRRVMWFEKRDKPSAQYVSTLEQIGAAPSVVEAARSARVELCP